MKTFDNRILSDNRTFLLFGDHVLLIEETRYNGERIILERHGQKEHIGNVVLCNVAEPHVEQWAAFERGMMDCQIMADSFELAVRKLALHHIEQQRYRKSRRAL